MILNKVPCVADVVDESSEKSPEGCGFVRYARSCEQGLRQAADGAFYAV